MARRHCEYKAEIGLLQRDSDRASGTANGVVFTSFPGFNDSRVCTGASRSGASSATASGSGPFSMHTGS